MMRRTMLLALVVLCLSLMFNLLLARPRLSSATAAPMAITCDDVWCCVFDWGCFFNIFIPDTHQWKCCELVPGGCVGCYEIDGASCCDPTP